MTSSASDDSSSPMGSHLARMIRQGRSFSGHEKNCVFLNTHDQRFANASFVSGLDFPDDARAAAQVDWDADGDLDLWFSNRNAPQVRFLMNDAKSDNHFVAFQLQGSDCNRDAIGARVEVLPDGEQIPLLRTLKAGNGYMTQNSKRLHFGLGPSEKPVTVRVAWPGGSVQDFGKLQVDSHYKLVQGSPAKLQDMQTSQVSLKAKQVSLPKPSEKAAIYSATRLAVPRLSYETPAGQALNIVAAKPTLLVLWASWCQPCVDELIELGRHQSELKAQGVRVLALSVDKLDMDGGDVQKANELLKTISFPFESGFALESTVAKMQLVNDFLFGLQKPLPVPTSFLLDSQFQLAAIYRGPVDVSRVQSDLRNIDQTVAERRDTSVPFAGRWLGKPTTLRLAPFVTELARAGFVEDASEYVQRIQNTFDQATILDLVVSLGVRYYEAGMRDHANLHFQMARKIQPNTILPEMRLAKHLQSTGAYRESLQVLRGVVKRQPKNAAAMNALAWLLATCPDKSVQDSRLAANLVRPLLAANAREPMLLDTLAASQAAEENFAKAIEAAREAESTARKAGRFRLAGDIARRIHRYEKRQSYLMP